MPDLLPPAPVWLPTQALPPEIRRGPCRGATCGATIGFIETAASGKDGPVELMGYTGVQIPKRIVGAKAGLDRAGVFRWVRAPEVGEAGIPLTTVFESHYANCPDRAAFGSKAKS